MASRVNVAGGDVMRADGGQCKSQTECNDAYGTWCRLRADATDTQTDGWETDPRTDRQTDRAGSWSAFSSIASGVGGLTRRGWGCVFPPQLLPGRFSGSSQTGGEEDTSCRPGPALAQHRSTSACVRGLLKEGARRPLGPASEGSREK